MKITALLVLIMAISGPGSFFGTGKKNKPFSPWQWAKSGEAQQESPNAPPMMPLPDGQMMTEPEAGGQVTEQSWQQLEQSAGQLNHKWLVTDAENIALLARAERQQNENELKLLRRIAEQEQAAETVKAIDKLLALRNERYEQIIEKARDERRQRMLEKRKAKQSRSRERLSSEERRRAYEERRRSRDTEPQPQQQLPQEPMTP